MSKLTFVLPTCEPDTIEKYLVKSLKYLLSIKDKISFGICFQPPYTEQQIQDTITWFEPFDFKYIFKDYKIEKPKVPLMKMRNDCAMLYPNSDYYALLDDDMEFEEGIDKYYDDVIKSMDEDQKLCVCSFSKRPVALENCFYTNAGLIYRGGKYYGYEGLVPHRLPNECYTLKPYDGEDLTELFGGHQDELCAMIRIAQGGLTKSYINVPTRHWENRKVFGYIQHGWKGAEPINGSVCSFIRKYFCSLYDLAHRNPIFDEKLKLMLSHQRRVLLVEQLAHPMKFTLNLNKYTKVYFTNHSTPRDERSVNSNSIKYSFKVTKAEDYKEFTVLQLHSLDNGHVPVIRISIIDNSIYITYKDNCNVNHYTKLDNFELNQDYTISINITSDSIEINDGKWKYERWFNKHEFRYGIYSQTDFGNYELVVHKIEIDKVVNNWVVDKYRNVKL